MDSTLLQQSLVHCRKAAKNHAQSFYFSAFSLPRNKRDAAYAVYAFCRYADEFVDTAPEIEGMAEVLKDMGTEFDRMLKGDTMDPPFAPAFAWAVTQFGIERSLFVNLKRGLRSTARRVRFATWPDLREHCYFVTSLEGLMMARVLGLKDPRGRDHAIDLGLAIQLTNICRDVGTDIDRDRIYIPACELERFGVKEEDLIAKKVTSEFKEMMQYHVHRARVHFQRAEHGIRLLHDDGSQFTVWLLREIYAGILDEIEKAEFDTLTRRVSTSRFRKVILCLRAWKKYQQSKATS